MWEYGGRGVLNRYFYNRDDKTRCACGWLLQYDRTRTWAQEVREHECPIDFNVWVRQKAIDWHNTDKAYWKALRGEIREKRIGMLWGGGLPCPTRDPRRVDAALRHLRYGYRMERQNARLESPRAQYGWFIGSIIQAALDNAKETCGDLCIDNERWCNLRKSADVRRFKRRRAQGCCGSHEEEVKIPFVGRFLIGFNYGH